MEPARTRVAKGGGDLKNFTPAIRLFFIIVALPVILPSGAMAQSGAVIYQADDKADAYFGGQPQDIFLRLSHGDPSEFEKFTASLHQLTSASEILIQDNLAIASTVPILSVKKPELRLSGTVHTDLPAVRRPTDFLLRFRRTGESSENVPAGEFRIRVYPTDLLSGWKTWSGHVQLRVHDPQELLSPFLKDQDFDFEEFRTPAREPLPIVNLIVPGGQPRFPRERYVKSGQTTIFFDGDIEPLPRVVVNKTETARVIDVHLPVLSGIAHNPKKQLMLAEILQLTLD